MWPRVCFGKSHGSIQEVLVGVDFEPPSLAALDWAIDLACQVGANITVLHAYEIPVVCIPDGAFIASAQYAAKLMTAAEEALAAAIGPRRGRGVELVSLLKQGVAWETIHQVADELDAGLIVVGTHGRKGLTHALLGSIAEKTIRTAKRHVAGRSGFRGSSRIRSPIAVTYRLVCYKRPTRLSISKAHFPPSPSDTSRTRCPDVSTGVSTIAARSGTFAPVRICRFESRTCRT
jgi:nucleotide-binding universal stress UspA family protein